jgi:alpha-beta hydrolase superfamily lysophospholipase
MRLLLLGIFLGVLPAAAAPVPEPNPLRAMAKELQADEKKITGLLKGAEARIDFGDPGNPKVTEHAILYLHGFSASPVESYPLTENLARRWNANTIFARFRGHGIEGPEGMRGVKLEHWLVDTRRALEHARMLGRKVVVLATSTGASLVLPELIASPEGIEAVVLQSPNFGLYAQSSELLLAPYPIAWLLGALVLGPYRSFEPLSPRQALWWTTRYPFQAVLEMMRAMDLGRKARLEELKLPVLVLYSERDRVVSVEKMKEAFARMGSEKKEMREVKSAENDHVLTGITLSPSGTAEAEGLIAEFLGGLPLGRDR